MNRGIARRTLFETERDRRFFLALVARQVRAGRIEVHAYSVMLNHFHLLIRSVRGELSVAMRLIQNTYSRYFNRSRKRDGPLYRSRFLSYPIDGRDSRRKIVVYIHDNGVKVKRAACPTEDEWCSAYDFVQDRRPKWLATDWIDEEVAARGKGGVGAAGLMEAFPCRIDKEFRERIERQLSQRLPDELEDVTLKHVGSPRVARWAMRKAELADGTRPFRPALVPQPVEDAVAKAKKKLGALTGYFKRKSKDAWNVLHAGLLRLLAGCKHYEIGRRVDRHASTISRDVRDHLELLRTRSDYAQLAAQVATAALTSR